MKLRDTLTFAGVGLGAGIIAVVLVGYVIFPTVIGDGVEQRGGAALLVLAMAMLLISPAALLGGLLGGRMIMEGGRGSQLIMAALLGIVATIPFACISLWYLGW